MIPFRSFPSNQQRYTIGINLLSQNIAVASRTAHSLGVSLNVCPPFERQPRLECGLDLNLAQSGCKFGVDGRTILQALLRRPQLELRLIMAVIAKSKARVNMRASQAHSHGFSNSRQTYVPKAPITSPIRIESNNSGKFLGLIRTFADSGLPECKFWNEMGG